MQKIIDKMYAEWARLEYELKDARKEKGWKAAAARARKETFVLEKLLKDFRKVSCAEARGWNVAGAIVAKHEFNKSRPYKHGKEF